MRILSIHWADVPLWAHSHVTVGISVLPAQSAFLFSSGWISDAEVFFQDRLNPNDYVFIQDSVSFPNISKFCCTVFSECIYLGIPIKFQVV